MKYLKRFSLGVGLLVLVSCADSSTAPTLAPVNVKASDLICPQGSSVVIRVGEDGQPHEVCEPY
jgi:hypothetical protein